MRVRTVLVICGLLVLSSSGCLFVEHDGMEPRITVYLSGPTQEVDAQGVSILYSEEYQIHRIWPNGTRMRWKDLEVRYQIAGTCSTYLPLSSSPSEDRTQICALFIDSTVDFELMDVGDRIRLTGIDPSKWPRGECPHPSLHWKNERVGEFYFPILLIISGTPKLERRMVNGNFLWDAEVPLERVDPVTTPVLWIALVLEVRSKESTPYDIKLLLRTPVSPLNATNGNDAAGPTVTWYSAETQDGVIRAGDILRINGMDKSYEGSKMIIIRMDGGTGWSLTTWMMPTPFD